MGLFGGGLTCVLPVVQLNLSGLPQLRRYQLLGPLYTEAEHKYPFNKPYKGNKDFNEYHRPYGYLFPSPCRLGLFHCL